MYYVRATCDNHSNRVELYATTRNTSTRVSSELIRGDRLLRDVVPSVDYHRQVLFMAPRNPKILFRPIQRNSFETENQSKK